MDIRILLNFEINCDPVRLKWIATVQWSFGSCLEFSTNFNYSLNRKCALMFAFWSTKMSIYLRKEEIFIFKLAKEKISCLILYLTFVLVFLNANFVFIRFLPSWKDLARKKEFKKKNVFIIPFVHRLFPLNVYNLFLCVPIFHTANNFQQVISKIYSFPRKKESCKGSKRSTPSMQVLTSWLHKNCCKKEFSGNINAMNCNNWKYSNCSHQNQERRKEAECKK